MHTPDLKTFADYHMSALLKDEVENNLLISVLSRNLDQQGSTLRFWTMNGPGNCAVQSPSWPIILARMNLESCRELASIVADLDYPAVVGPACVSAEFRKTSGRSFLTPVDQPILSLSGKPNTVQCRGKAKVSTSTDSDVVADWVLDFHRETVPHDPEPDLTYIKSAAATGEYLLWIDNGNPVSMAKVGRRTINTAAINSVYTPPAFRGNGYAAAVTAQLSKRELANGKATVCLFANADDPRAMRCYSKVGFQPHCEFQYAAVCKT